MEWTPLIATGLVALTWLLVLYQAQRDDWRVVRTVGWLVFLGGATGGLLLDDSLFAESSLPLWMELLPPVGMLAGVVIVWVWRPEEDDRSANSR